MIIIRRQVLFTLLTTLFISACGDSSERQATAVWEGVWEAPLGREQTPTGLMLKRGQLTLSDNRYRYDWYRRMASADSNSLSNWVLTSRETGTLTVGGAQMTWIAENRGSARFDPETKTWGNLQMHAVNNIYEIHFRMANGRLITQEDYNLDGDFDDSDPIAETVVYKKTGT